LDDLWQPKVKQLFTFGGEKAVFNNVVMKNPGVQTEGRLGRFSGKVFRYDGVKW
jgi:hypothetical protein